MKLLIMCLFISSLSVFGQTTDSNENVHKLGQKNHNCDEPCLKCGHQEACKDTKGTDVNRDKKELPDNDEAKKADHGNHQHNTTEQ